MSVLDTARRLLQRSTPSTVALAVVFATVLALVVAFGRTPSSVNETGTQVVVSASPEPTRSRYTPSRTQSATVTITTAAPSTTLTTVAPTVATTTAYVPPGDPSTEPPDDPSTEPPDDGCRQALGLDAQPVTEPDDGSTQPTETVAPTDPPTSTEPPSTPPPTTPPPTTPPTSQPPPTSVPPSDGC